MAVELTKSTQLTNRDAVPRVINSPGITKADIKQAAGSVEVSATASIASIFRICQIPSNACGELVKLYCDAITSGASDIGIYRTVADGGAVVDVDFYASAQAISAAITTGTEVQHEADATDAGVGNGLADLEKPLWQRLQLTSDPGVEYDIAFTLTAAATAAGTLGLRVQYGV